MCVWDKLKGGGRGGVCVGGKLQGGVSHIWQTLRGEVDDDPLGLFDLVPSPPELLQHTDHHIKYCTKV